MADDDTPVTDEAAPALTLTQKLARFMLDKWDGDDFTTNGGDEAALSVLEPLAEHVLADFFRLDQEAVGLYAIPGVDGETLQPFAMVHWGAMAGRIETDELRAIGSAFIETAEAADLDAHLVGYLMRDPACTVDNAARVMAAFRTYRAEHDLKA